MARMLSEMTISVAVARVQVSNFICHRIREPKGRIDTKTDLMTAAGQNREDTTTMVLLTTNGSGEGYSQHLDYRLQVI
jgi:hypothetical protein